MQKTLRIAALILAVMVVVVLAVAPVSAAPALQGGSGGTGGNNGGGNGAAGMNNWHTIMPGQLVEWVFNYTGNNDPATIELASNPQGAVRFNVFTDAQWVSGDIAAPVGAGTQQTTTDKDTGVTTARNNGDVSWTTAASGGSQRFHVQVYSTSQQPAQYWINGTGAGFGSMTAFNANASNTSLQGQAAQTTGTNAGASTSGNAGTSAGTGSNAGNSQAPKTLPQTGGSDLAVLFTAAAAALITGGWLARRRTNLIHR